MNLTLKTAVGPSAAYCGFTDITENVTAFRSRLRDTAAEIEDVVLNLGDSLQTMSAR